MVRREEEEECKQGVNITEAGDEIGGGGGGGERRNSLAGRSQEVIFCFGTDNSATSIS